MTPNSLAVLLNEINRRTSEKPRVIDVLGHPDVFWQQKNFIKDPAKLKALFCTRRSAKSFTAGLYLVHEALNNPGCNVLFIGLTRASAKAIIWKDILRVLDKKHGLAAKPNQAELTMTLPNGSLIAVTGVDSDQSEMMKLLGRKWRLVCIDEASMYTINTRNLVYGILGPAMVDPNSGGDMGTICMLGTASDLPRGLFFDVTTGKEPGWKLFEWSAHDNPHVARQWQENLEQIAQNRPLYMETPQFKQWFLNQWVVDENKLVYRFNRDRNLCDNLPHLPHVGWVFVLGVDTGWEDDNAFVLTGYHQNNPTAYVVSSHAQKQMTFDQVAAKIQEYMNDPEYPISKVFIDGANKQGVESMRQRSNIPFEYADKQDKATFIELCNADLVQARVKIVNSKANQGLIDEMNALIWVTDGDTIKIPKKEHPALPNHRCDAFLYAWRNGYHYHWGALAPVIPIGSKAWFEKQAEDIWTRERENIETANGTGKDWGESGGW